MSDWVADIRAALNLTESIISAAEARDMTKIFKAMVRIEGQARGIRLILKRVLDEMAPRRRPPIEGEPP